MPGNKDGFGMFGRKPLACLGRAGLEDHRGALGRWLADVRPRYVIILAYMINCSDQCGVGVDALLSV